MVRVVFDLTMTIIIVLFIAMLAALAAGVL